MQRRMSIALLAAAVAATMGAAACSDEDRDSVGDAVDTIVDEAEEAGRTAISEVGDAADEALDDGAEALARNIATQQGEEQFADAGSPLDDGGLACTATVGEGVDDVAVSCTGTTQDGGAAALTGTTSELPGASAVELEGDFTGTVDGAEVFTTDRLGG